MSDHDLMLKMQNYLPVETQDLIAELTAERALKQRQFEAVLAERAALRLQVAALAAERDFVQGKLVRPAPRRTCGERLHRSQPRRRWHQLRGQRRDG